MVIVKIYSTLGELKIHSTMLYLTPLDPNFGKVSCCHSMAPYHVAWCNFLSFSVIENLVNERKEEFLCHYSIPFPTRLGITWRKEYAFNNIEEVLNVALEGSWKTCPSQGLQPTTQPRDPEVSLGGTLFKWVIQSHDTVETSWYVNEPLATNDTQ